MEKILTMMDYTIFQISEYLNETHLEPYDWYYEIVIKHERIRKLKANVISEKDNLRAKFLKPVTCKKCHSQYPKKTKNYIRISLLDISGKIFTTLLLNIFLVMYWVF